MNGQIIVTAILMTVGLLAAVLAVRQERLMQRHRQPGVAYRDVTLRRDGGWRRTEPFTAQGLTHQRQASRYGLTALALWLAALAAWTIIGWR